jgi:hypothetical protein
LKPLIQDQIINLEQKHGEVPPPWVIFLEHPYSICWRMGGGEDHIIIWGAWWRAQSFTEDQRINYFRKWSPPHCWLRWVIRALWGAELDPDDFDFDDTLYFARMERLGFGSKVDFERDLDDPKWLEE